MADQTTNPKRNHHVLPQLYLKGFTIKGDEPHLWVYKRGEPFNPGQRKLANNPFRSSIRIAGAQRDFYADPQQQGGKDFETFENSLELLEKPANPIFEKIRARLRISEEEKHTFSKYIVLTMRRVWAGRDYVTRRLQQTGWYVPTPDLFRKLNLPATPEGVASIMHIGELISQKPGVDIQVHNRLAAAAPDSFLVQALPRMTWTFYTTPTGYDFVTSDNPVYLPQQLGLAKNVSELLFPISTSVALVASWNKDAKEGFVESSGRIVKELNRRTTSAASRHVYAAMAVQWALNGLNSRKYEYRPLIPSERIHEVVRLVPTGDHLRARLEWHPAYNVNS